MASPEGPTIGRKAHKSRASLGNSRTGLGPPYAKHVPLGIRFREDGEGRLHVEQLTAGGAGKACGELQVGDILSELDGVAMQASLLRGTRMRARRTRR